MNEPIPQNDPSEETLAQRSARLEAEAASGKFGVETTASEPSDNAETGQLKNVIKGLQDELDKTKDQALRAMAEAENARKRAAKEREDASKFAIAGFARDLLSVADNLRRAVSSIPADAMAADPHLKNLNDGVEATERELLKTFEKNGLKKIMPENEMFNPNLHEVMFEAPATGKPAGTIVQVMEPGYVLNDRLLRPARVAVAKDEGQGSGEPGSRIDTKA